MANKNEFNKTESFDELTKIMNLPQGAPISEILKAVQNGQDFLQKIHDEAFALGFEKGCEASKKVDEL